MFHIISDVLQTTKKEKGPIDTGYKQNCRKRQHQNIEIFIKLFKIICFIFYRYFQKSLQWYFGSIELHFICKKGQIHNIKVKPILSSKKQYSTVHLTPK